MTGRRARGLPCSLVDVFGTDQVSGNPLAVVHDADGLDPDQMQRIARWMNLSETVFLCRPTASAADYAVRIFALDRELAWAGHPTLGACHAWIAAGGHGRSPGRTVQQSAAGLTIIHDDGNRLAFEAPPLIRLEPPSERELAEALRLVGSQGQGLIAAMWIDNGPGWLGLLFERAEMVLSLEPERCWPAALHIGVAGFHAPGAEAAIETRAFHTDQFLRLVEDPVTGSFNAALARWLVESGRMPPGYAVAQGQCVGRKGRIEVGLCGGALTIAGQTATVIRGAAFLA